MDAASYSAGLLHEGLEARQVRRLEIPPLGHRSHHDE